MERYVEGDANFSSRIVVCRAPKQRDIPAACPETNYLKQVPEHWTLLFAMWSELHTNVYPHRRQTDGRDTPAPADWVSGVSQVDTHSECGRGFRFQGRRWNYVYCTDGRGTAAAEFHRLGWFCCILTISYDCRAIPTDNIFDRSNFRTTDFL